MTTATNISRRVVQYLRKAEAPASVSDDNFRIVLELIENSTHRKEAGI